MTHLIYTDAPQGLRLETPEGELFGYIEQLAGLPFPWRYISLDGKSCGPERVTSEAAKYDALADCIEREAQAKKAQP